MAVKKAVAIGVDLSQRQGGNINFDAIKNNGYSFVLLRAGYGDQADKEFESRYKAARAAGLNVGAYWDSRAETAKLAEIEAATCFSVIQDKALAYPIYYRIHTPHKSKCGAIVTSFCGSIHSSGYAAGVYMSRCDMERYLPAKVTDVYSAWVAEYNDRCKYPRKYDIWQYTSACLIPGCDKPVGLNKAYINAIDVIDTIDGIDSGVKTATKNTATRQKKNNKSKK